LLLGITPEGVEIAANASKAMGAQFDVLVATFIKPGVEPGPDRRHRRVGPVGNGPRLPAERAP